MPPLSAPAADHAAALWQLCCRIGRTATVTCQMVGSHARCHHLSRATGARRGVNAGTAQRAGDGSRAYPANRHRLWIRTRSFVRRWPVQRPIGAASGPVTRTHTLMRKLLGRGSIPCAVRRQTHVFAAGAMGRGGGNAQVFLSPLSNLLELGGCCSPTPKNRTSFFVKVLKPPPAGTTYFSPPES